MRLSAFIKVNVRIIVDDWEQFARTLLPAAGNLDSLALRDHAKQILLAIAEDISSWQSASDSVDKSHGWSFRAAQTAETAAEVHGALRRQHGFNMVQLAAEFRALRSSVLRLWGTRSEDSVAYADDILRFNEAIDQALAESIDKFTSDVDRGRNLFLGILGHDIKTPLTAVTLTADALARRHLEDESELKLVRRIQRNVSTINTVITDLLEFVRLDLGKEMTLNRTATDFGSLAAAAVDDCDAVHPGAHIQLILKGELSGRWDDGRIRQLLRALINHAISSSNAEAEVLVSVERRGTDLVVTVENEGPKIPLPTNATLFDPLVRSDVGLQSPSEAAPLGLDLYIGREIVTAHGGTVIADFQGGKNSVTAVLPVVGPVANE